MPAGTPADADAAVRAAAAAFPGWAATPLAERVAAVRRINDGLQGPRERAGRDDHRRGRHADRVRHRRCRCANPVGIADGVLAEIEAGALDPVTIGNSTVVREPIGVVAAITPWNFPLQQMVAKVAPALAAGNTVVLKPSEVAPLTAGLLAEIIDDAGLPAGVFNMVHGTGPVVGEALAAHPLVDMVSFTGSTRAGRRVAAVGAETIKRVALELGGKSASVVLDDADLVRAVKITRGQLLHEQRPGVQRADPAAGPRGPARRGRRGRGRGGVEVRARRPRPGGHPDRPVGVRRAARPRGRLHPQGRRGGRDAGARRARSRSRARGYFVRPDGVRRRRAGHDDRAGGDLRPGAVDHALHRRGRRRADRQRHPVRPGRGRVRRRRGPRVRGGGQAARGPGRHQRRAVQHQAPRSAASSSRATAASSAASAWRSSPS